MSHRVYCKGICDQCDGRDMYGYYSEISDEEFETLKSSGLIEERNGIYYYIEGVSEQSEAVKEQKRIDSSYDNGGGIFSNPGNKLKNIAEAMFIIFSIASVIAGIGAGKLYGGLEVLSGGEPGFSVLALLLVSIVGIIASYIACLAISAFGELVINSQKDKK